MKGEVTRIADVAATIESWAPRASAQSYDNVGLQIGDPTRTVTKAVIALDATPAVVDEAIAVGAELIITHHPLIFRPLTSITPATFVSSVALRIAENGIALYAAHTNLDAANGGVSFALADKLGLRDVRFLSQSKDNLVKLVTFVPDEQIAAVRAALAEAGAGVIGAYRACSFSTPGTGTFQAESHAEPALGAAGGPLERVAELRLEVQLERWLLDGVVQKLRSVHPYEEVAYDVYAVEQSSTNVGLGAVGELDHATTLSSFLERVCSSLGAGSLRFVGDTAATVQRIAVCGGSGSDLVAAALAAGADAFVTADVTYHRFFDVLDIAAIPRMALIDAGHYETEAMIESALAKWLQDRFPLVHWSTSTTKSSPVRTFVPSAGVV